MQEELQKTDVDRLVERIIQDTTHATDDRLNLLNASGETRIKLIELLRGQDLPVLSTDGVCGPG